MSAAGGIYDTSAVMLIVGTIDDGIPIDLTAKRLDPAKSAFAIEKEKN